MYIVICYNAVSVDQAEVIGHRPSRQRVPSGQSTRGLVIDSTHMPIRPCVDTAPRPLSGCRCDTVSVPRFHGGAVEPLDANCFFLSLPSMAKKAERTGSIP